MISKVTTATADLLAACATADPDDAARNAHAALENGAQVDVPDNTQMSALHHAAQLGHARIVAALLEGKEGSWKPAALGATDRYGDTAFGLAANRAHAAVVALLLKGGADPLHKNRNGYTVQMNAQGAEVNALVRMTPAQLKVLADHSYSQIVQTYEAAAGKTQEKPERPVTPGASYTADDVESLVNAAKRGHVEMVAAQLMLGVPVDAASKTGWTALSAAAAKEHVDIARFLLEKGADVLVKDKDGETALDNAEGAEMKELLAEAAKIAKDHNQMLKVFA